ncbi:MAG: hypothetical protein HKN10_01625 [Myxococcales bacterium]|nr:hypothetical protein [Deltaproteobacteria bacterium]NNE17152.1 hypothetical protein [Myxococcales bacterium]
MSYPGAPPEPARLLRLNGGLFSFRTQTVEASLDEVVLHYQLLCSGRHAGLFERLSTQSARGKDAGHVVCLDMGDAPRDLRSLANGFVRFSETGDIGALGGLRYMRARRVSGAPVEQTLVLTVWADSPFNLFQMLPADDADAGGSDVPAVPRPRSSQRLLSAWEAGSPSGFVVYRVPNQSGADLVSFYRDELSASGWTIIERHPSESIAIDDVRMISAERGKRMVTVLTRSTDASDTVLSILISEPS